MRFGSVCSGIEAASLAFGAHGWEAAWFSEIEPFPSAVLAHRFPRTFNLGDMRDTGIAVETRQIEAPDLLVGGTPCQAFSVAGNRESLDDVRGNLTLTFCEIADAIDTARRRAGRKPAVVFWENVPGVLSTKDNAFGCFLGRLAGEDCALEPPGGRWTDAGMVLGPARAVAWRVLDAQYFGLAQRRRRVFVVASARDGFDPGAVLLEFDGVRRDSAPRRCTQEVPAGTLAGGARKRGGFSYDDVPLAFGGNNCSGPIAAAAALNAHGGAGRMDFESETFIVGTLCGCGKAAGSATQQDAESGMLIPLSVLPFDTTQITHPENRCRPQWGGTGHPIAAGGHPPAIAFNARQDPDVWVERTGPLDTDGATQAILGRAMRVRRLTPTECERLQGFPDGHTAVPHRGKPAADGPRYKAIGNSWAVACVEWIADRITTEFLLS